MAQKQQKPVKPKKTGTKFNSGTSPMIPKYTHTFVDSDTTSLSVHHRYSHQEKKEMRDKENFVKSMKRQIPIENLIKISSDETKQQQICLKALGEFVKYANSMEYGAKPDFPHLLEMFYSAIVQSSSSSNTDSSSSITWI
jgi:hypothetical protein